MSLSGTHHKKEPLSQNGSAEGSFSRVFSFLYILDLTAFPLEVIEATMYKKPYIYTYAKTRKIYIYWKNMIQFSRCSIHSSTSIKSNLSPMTKMRLLFYFVIFLGKFSNKLPFFSLFYAKIY